MWSKWVKPSILSCSNKHSGADCTATLEDSPHTKKKRRALRVKCLQLVFVIKAPYCIAIRSFVNKHKRETCRTVGNTCGHFGASIFSHHPPSVGVRSGSPTALFFRCEVSGWSQVFWVVPINIQVLIVQPPWRTHPIQRKRGELCEWSVYNLCLW